MHSNERQADHFLPHFCTVCNNECRDLKLRRPNGYFYMIKDIISTDCSSTTTDSSLEFLNYQTVCTKEHCGDRPFICTVCKKSCAGELGTKCFVWNKTIISNKTVNICDTLTVNVCNICLTFTVIVVDTVATVTHVFTTTTAATAATTAAATTAATTTTTTTKAVNVSDTSAINVCDTCFIFTAIVVDTVATFTNVTAAATTAATPAGAITTKFRTISCEIRNQIKRDFSNVNILIFSISQISYLYIFLFYCVSYPLFIITSPCRSTRGVNHIYPFLHSFFVLFTFFFILYLALSSTNLPDNFSKTSFNQPSSLWLSPVYQPFPFSSVCKCLDKIPIGFFINRSIISFKFHITKRHIFLPSSSCW